MNLPEFEGRFVRKAQLRITSAGDGLSEALSVLPKAWHHGDEVFLVLKGVITQVNHKPEKEEDEDLVRIHTLKAHEVTEVAEDDIESFLSEARNRIRKAKDEASGQEDMFDGAKGKAEAATEADKEPQPVA